MDNQTDSCSMSSRDDSELRPTEVPRLAKKLLQCFRECVTEGNSYEAQYLHENRLPRVMEEEFDQPGWTEENDTTEQSYFLALYKELYYRNIYASAVPTLEQRFKSFYNYCDLFSCIIGSVQAPVLELSDHWLWEIMDEFVYQFQSFARYRLLQKISPEERAILSNDSNVWNVINVLNALYSLINKSNINESSDAEETSKDVDFDSLYLRLGYYSLAVLLRLHCLFGDYSQALTIYKQIEAHKNCQYAQVPACTVSIAYYIGFTFIMLRRYCDAVHILLAISSFTHRNKHLFQNSNYQNDQINKHKTQVHHLLAICFVLSPFDVDETIDQIFREKNFYDMIYKMQCGDMDTYETCFLYACPKFLPTGLSETYDAGGDLCDNMIVQKGIFLEEVRHQKLLPTIRSYLKLYSSLPLSKLASYLNPRSNSDNDVYNLITCLLCLKHKLFESGASGDKTPLNLSHTDFFIDNDTIFVLDIEVTQSHGQFFIHKITELDAMQKKLGSFHI